MDEMKSMHAENENETLEITEEDMATAASAADEVDKEDSLYNYLKEVGSIPLLTDEQEKDFGEKLTAGNEARDALVNGNLRLVVAIAKKYVGKGFDFMDLIQMGNMGLLEAADSFDCTKGYKFSTYAAWWIRRAIEEAFEDAAEENGEEQ